MRRRKPKLVVVPQLHADHGCDNVVKLLREIYEKAKAGQLRAVAVAFEYVDGDVSYQCAMGKNARPAHLIGEVTVMQHAMIHRML